jgi:hypothetical protein
MSSRPAHQNYPIIGLLIGTFYFLGVLVLMAGLGLAVFLLARGQGADVPLSGAVVERLNVVAPHQVKVAAGLAAGAGVVALLALGAVGQFLSMQRDRAINAGLQVQLLEDILELNEEVTAAAHGTRVEMCEGCGRLGSLHRIDSGQWMCRDCRRQLRSA